MQTATQPTILAAMQAGTTAPTVQSCTYQCSAGAMRFSYTGTYAALLAYLESTCAADFAGKRRVTWLVSNRSTGTRFSATYSYSPKYDSWALAGTGYPS